MTISENRVPEGRYSHVDGEKSKGATYTPLKLAQFVAGKMVGAWKGQKVGRVVRVLDPAAGDGELLLALLHELRVNYPDLPVEAFGFEPDSEALGKASARLSKRFPDIPAYLTTRDFLQETVNQFGSDGQLSLFSKEPPDTYDLVIANPPYVRTQIIGASQAQFLGRQFRLSGRIDLYHAFMLAISKVVESNGLAGMIVSNRFMTTRSGANVRSAMLENLRLLSVWDFGDTKLFGAAVLPAVLLASGIHKEDSDAQTSFTSIYETRLPQESWAPDPIDALSHSGVVEVNDGRRFVVRHGKLETSGKKDGVWRIANKATESWLETVTKHTWGTFRDIGKVHVGVKTCADKVFIRSDWTALPAKAQPELLRSIITHHTARRFKPLTSPEQRFILYPHESIEGVRKAVDLRQYPQSATYLESHREVLENRKYVMDSGREWFEIWVPHDPDAWRNPKLVFRDIAEDLTCWIDLDGSVVNGDCYWLSADDASKSDLLWMAVAVGNSSFIQCFYDYRFHNRLYGGRRRFMTQYVEEFPLPNPLGEPGREIIAKARQVFTCVGTREGDDLEEELNELVWEAFGLPIEKMTR